MQININVNYGLGALYNLIRSNVLYIVNVDEMRLLVGRCGAEQGQSHSSWAVHLLFTHAKI
ncbi:hypothetical protein T11_17119 [Trichinella zimbabwensis]|uniref:Uncharacterized protein n=1 Tax=Trichinella zimbabwensis TaxID=268475 RepID=A0A0V1HEK8_9BILA|nr:hypothetical protein T11_17119 [Trichinella zimbabwensis]